MAVTAAGIIVKIVIDIHGRSHRTILKCIFNGGNAGTDFFIASYKGNFLTLILFAGR